MRERFLLDLNNVVIHDEAGRSRRMPIFSTRLGFRKLAHELPPATRKPIYRFMRQIYCGPAYAYSIFVLTPICLVVFAVVFFGLGALRIGQIVPGMWIGIVRLGMYVPLSLVIVELVGMRLMRRWYRHAYTTAMLSNALCPWCGYGLAGLPIDEHQLVHCPECTGCWPSPDLEPAGTSRYS